MGKIRCNNCRTKFDVAEYADLFRTVPNEELFKCLRCGSDNLTPVEPFVARMFKRLFELSKFISKKKVYPVEVDYSKSLAEMIAMGKYDDETFTSDVDSFTVERKDKIKVDLRLINLNREATTDEVIQHLNQLRLRPATLPELLAFGAKYPEEQRKVEIISPIPVGSSVDKAKLSFPCLFKREGGAFRILGVQYFERDKKWYDFYVFLAAPK